MAKAQSVKYSVLAATGAKWTSHVQTRDMAAALEAARTLLRSGQAPRVRVVKEFLDGETGRHVETTILDESLGPNPGGTAVVRRLFWPAIAIGMFLTGFGLVAAVKIFVL